MLSHFFLLENYSVSRGIRTKLNWNARLFSLNGTSNKKILKTADS